MEQERFLLVKSLVQSALEIEPGRREAYLGEVCGGDERLRREVQVLLSHLDQAGQFLTGGKPAGPNLSAAAGEPTAPDESRTDLSGNTIGPYEIISLIGRGGMGEVYRARDRRLGRLAALKVLPAEFAADPEGIRRFTREARAASALNHPNVATIYEIGESDGIHWIAMELVEGKSLAEQLKGKPLEINDVLDIGIQVAEALTEANNRRIIHRDIKPANLMWTPKRQIKVLDFGVASIEGKRRGMENSGSQSAGGLVIGTPTYMSPERGLGLAVDRRTDIFSLGVVLFELATGQPPFLGNNSITTIDAIVHKPLVWPAQTQNRVPPELRRIIGKALEKFRSKRYQSAADLCADLTQMKLDRALPQTPGRMGKRWAWAAVLGAVILALTIRLEMPRKLPSTAEEPLLAVPLTTYPGSELSPSFSPDGSQVAFLWDGEKQENFGVYVKAIGIEPPLLLADGVVIEPVWSPDGRWIAFLRGIGVNTVELVIKPPIPGPERVVASWTISAPPSNTSPPMLSWSADSRWIAFYATETDDELPAIFLLHVDTLVKRRFTQPPKNCAGDSGPAFSHDGRSLAYCRFTSWGNTDILVQRLSDDFRPAGDPLKIEAGGKVIGLAWTPDSMSLVFSAFNSQGTNLWRVDLSGLRQPRKLSVGASGLQPAVSRRGNRLGYTEERSDENLWRVDLPPNRRAPAPFRRKIVASTRGDWYPQFSHDGRRLSFVSNRTGSHEIWMCNPDGSYESRLTSLHGVMVSSRPIWSPDDTRLTFEGYAEGYSSLYLVDTRNGITRKLTSDPAGPANPSWSHDGKWIFFDTPNVGIQRMPADGGPVTLITGKVAGWGPVESQDGRFIYFLKSLPKSGGPGISLWRMTARGTDQERVIETLAAGCNFAVTDKGIYYITTMNGGSAFRYLDFMTGKSSDIFAAPNACACLSVSPEGRSIVYMQVDSSGYDIMLVDNFH